MMADSNFATASAPVYVQYFAKEVEYQSAIKFPCALYENLIPGSFVAWFNKGMHCRTNLTPHQTKCGRRTRGKILGTVEPRSSFKEQNEIWR